MVLKTKVAIFRYRGFESHPHRLRKEIKNMIKNNNTILVGGAIVFKDFRGKRTFLLVKPAEGTPWEIAKVTVRKGESSVRAVIRMTGEVAGMNAKVLEEAGRASGAATVGGRVVTQKFYYYLMLLKAASGEIMSFYQAKWFEYGKALKELTLKREKDVLKEAKEVLKEWEKKHPRSK